MDCERRSGRDHKLPSPARPHVAETSERSRNGTSPDHVIVTVALKVWPKSHSFSELPARQHHCTRPGVIRFPRLSERGFSLPELMMIVAVAGTLMLIAVPALKDVTEGS